MENEIELFLINQLLIKVPLCCIVVIATLKHYMKQHTVRNPKPGHSTKFFIAERLLKKLIPPNYVMQPHVVTLFLSFFR